MMLLSVVPVPRGDRVRDRRFPAPIQGRLLVAWSDLLSGVILDICTTNHILALQS